MYRRINNEDPVNPDHIRSRMDGLNRDLHHNKASGTCPGNFIHTLRLQVRELTNYILTRCLVLKGWRL